MAAANLLGVSGKLLPSLFNSPAAVGGEVLMEQPAGAATAESTTVNVQPGYYWLELKTTFGNGGGSGATLGSYDIMNVYVSGGTATLNFGEITVATNSMVITPNATPATALATASGNYHFGTMLWFATAGTAVIQYDPVASMNYGPAGGMTLLMVQLSQQ
jgi:hypothetical protein